MREKVRFAKEYAIDTCDKCCCLYDGQPYDVHLEMVYSTAIKFLDLVPIFDRTDVLCATWTHDLIEDCRQTYNDIKAKTNTEVAELTYALTNEKGRTRKERANDKYYQGIRETPNATFLKLCDRIANMEYSISKGSRMAEMYRKEMDEFCKSLYDIKYKEMFDYLKSL